MGTARIANWLNEHGYSKICRHNNKREAFTGSFLIGVLDNPVYCGKLAYGRRHNEKIPGTRNQYHIVKQKDYALYDGIHEPIISEEDWQLAQKQRQQTNKRQIKTHSLDHEHVLSGLLKCPVCGGGMYGNVNRKKKGDGTYYRDYFYYACKHRLHVDGKRCDYHHQWGEEIIDGAVEEIIHKLVNTPAFEQGIREKIGGKLDTAELDAEMETLRKQLRQLTGTKDRLGEQIDALDFDDPHYTRKAQDLQERQNRVYDQIASIEVSIAEVQTRMDNIRQHRISTDNVYQFLLYFDKLYDQFTDLEKKTFMNSFIERVEIYPERQSDGRIVKRIEFRFPVYFNGSEISGLCWDETDMSETVMCFSKGTYPHRSVKVEFPLEGLNVAQLQGSATYEQIKAYVLEHSGLKVSTLYIAQVKQKYGIIERECYNKPKSEDAKQPQCPPDKEAAIVEALKFYGLIAP